MSDPSDKPQNSSPQPAQPAPAMCPHLGLFVDPQTCMAYPSSQNFCHNADPPATPSMTHQSEFCLSANHTNCVVRLTLQSQPLPTDVAATIQRPIWHHWAARGAIGLALTLTLAGGAFWLLNRDRMPVIFAGPAPTPAPSATSTAPILVTATPTATLPTPTLTAAARSKTATPTPHIRHRLETPIGGDKKFIVHRVAEGESVQLLATLYDTYPESIRAINYNLNPSLWIDSVIILPAGRVDVTGVPPMTALRIEQDNLTIEALAANLGLDAAALRALNGLPEGYTFVSDEWVLIPHPAP